MPVRTAEAVWEGSLRGGNGRMRLGSGAYEGGYSFGSRFEESAGTNPEELIAAAHAGCFSMALSGTLGRAELEPRSVRTSAKAHLEKVGEGFKITRIELMTSVDVPGVDDETFQELAEKAKNGCPVSQALAGVEIYLDAKLVSSG